VAAREKPRSALDGGRWNAHIRSIGSTFPDFTALTQMWQIYVRKADAIPPFYREILGIRPLPIRKL
jgi:hypothetical protein